MAAESYADLESVQQCRFARIVLKRKTISAALSFPGNSAPYQAQDQYPYLLLSPQKAGQP